jgi:hypothetical protein
MEMTMTPTCLYDQMNDITRSATLSLIGLDADSDAGFSRILKMMPMLADDFTCGDVAVAYLEARLKYLKALPKKAK